MSDITGTLEGLRDGTVSVNDAASSFMARQWPVRRAHQPAVKPGDDLAADVADGSFGEVRAAYEAGWIDPGAYIKLAEAYNTAMQRAAAPGPTVPDSDAGTDADGDHDGDTFDWDTLTHAPAGQEDLFDTEGKGLPPVGAGAYVKAPDGTRGRISKVDGDTATVAVWAKGGDGWKATGKTITAKLSQLTRMPPLAGMGEKKDAEHEVYERGVQSFPGEQKTALSPHDWASGRVEAFRLRLAGEDVPGYSRDDDLL